MVKKTELMFNNSNFKNDTVNAENAKINNQAIMRISNEVTSNKP